MSTVQEKKVPSSLDTIESINPATLEVIEEVPVWSKEQVSEAIQHSRKAFESWSKAPFSARAGYVKNAQKYILDNIDKIAARITEENGKSIVESISSEILPVVELMDYFIQNTESLLGADKIALGRYALLGKKSVIEYKPLGVIGIISPWNFPFSIPMGELVMSLLVGNTVIIKPSEVTPLIGLMIGEIFKEAGLPENVVTIATGYGQTGAALIQKGVDKIIFTGSVRTGKRIMAAASEHLIPVVLELGGKDPMIVCSDVNIDIVSSAAVWGAFNNNGQVCASVERCYVHEAIADKFIEQVVEKTKKLRQGDGNSLDTDMGAMVSLEQLNIVNEQVEDARKNGANILTGGRRNPDLKGFYYEPTVMTGVDHSFKCMQEETFGPTLPIMTFKNEEEAIALANDSHLGLTASIWSQDIEYAERLARKLECGTVTINDAATTFALCQTPWGGCKESGIGRTHGKMGLHELVHIHHIHTDKAHKQKKFWWFHYGNDTLTLLKSSLKTFFAKEWSAAPAMIKEILKNKRL